MKKKEIESQIEVFEKEKLQAIKTQNYALAALIRDKVRDLMVQLRTL
jgi:protein-arginine kinase activator protein McsA